jgi:hypothetical protein
MHWLFTRIQLVLDRWDDHRARLQRQRLGLQGRILSWTRGGDGRWLARVSTSELPVTIVRAGKTRSRAAHRAEQALTRILDNSR